MKLARTALTATCLAALVLPGACSNDDSSDSSVSYERRSVFVGGANVSFDLPSEWEDFDRDNLQDAMTDNEVMDDLTDRMGVSSEQFGQMISSNMVLLVTAPHASGGYLGNVNVIVADGTLPRLGTIELQYRSLGASDVQTTETSTDAGDGYSTTYTLDLSGVEIHGAAIILNVNGQTVAVTIASHDDDESARLANRIRDSLTKTL